MWATRMSNIRAFFSQLYGNATVEADPASGGRQMGNHFATRFLDAADAARASVAPETRVDVLIALVRADELYEWPEWCCRRDCSR